MLMYWKSTWRYLIFSVKSQFKKMECESDDGLDTALKKYESVLENKMHKILWDFQIQTDYPILARRPEDLVFIDKKIICNLVDFDLPVDYRLTIKETKSWTNTWILPESWKFCVTRGLR